MIHNIEYAHIYTDQDPGREQELSIAATLQAIESIPITDSYTLTVMVDEYHPAQSSLVLVDYLDFLEEKGLLPHFMVMEGDLRMLAYRVLYTLPKKLRKEMNGWILKKDRFPCSLLTATWYIYRLNGFGRETIPMIQTDQLNRTFFGEEIVTVLPNMYRDNEHRAMRIIEESPWAYLRPHISYKWFDLE